MKLKAKNLKIFNKIEKKLIKIFTKKFIFKDIEKNILILTTPRGMFFLEAGEWIFDMNLSFCEKGRDLIDVLRVIAILNKGSLNIIIGEGHHILYDKKLGNQVGIIFVSDIERKMELDNIEYDESLDIISKEHIEQYTNSINKPLLAH